MKTLLLLASLAALTSAAFADTPTRAPATDDSVGVLPEFVVTARRAFGSEPVGVLPEYVVTAPKIAPAGAADTRTPGGPVSAKDNPPETRAPAAATGGTMVEAMPTRPRPVAVGQL